MEQYKKPEKSYRVNPQDDYLFNADELSLLRRYQERMGTDKYYGYQDALNVIAQQAAYEQRQKEKLSSKDPDPTPENDTI